MLNGQPLIIIGCVTTIVQRTLLLLSPWVVFLYVPCVEGIHLQREMVIRCDPDHIGPLFVMISGGFLCRHSLNHDEQLAKKLRMSQC